MSLLIGSLIFIINLNFAHADQIKDQLWQSKSIPKAIISAQYGDANNDQNPDVVYISTNELVAETFLSDGKLTLLARLKAGAKTSFYRVYLVDMNQDGMKEVLVLGKFRERYFSRLYAIRGKKFVLKQDYLDLVVPKNNSGKFYVQSAHNMWSCAQKIHEAELQGIHLVLGKEMVVNQGLGLKSPCLFQMSLLDKGFISNSNPKHLFLFDDAGKLIWRSNIGLGHSANFLEITQKDPMAISTKRQIEIPSRMAYYNKGQEFVAIRTDTYLKGAVGTKPVIKQSQLVRFKVNEQEIKEVKSSAQHPLVMTDLQVLDYNGDGQFEIFLSYIKQGKGFLGGYGEQQSVLVMIPYGFSK